MVGTGAHMVVHPPSIPHLPLPRIFIVGTGHLPPFFVCSDHWSLRGIFHQLGVCRVTRAACVVWIILSSCRARCCFDAACVVEIILSSYRARCCFDDAAFLLLCIKHAHGAPDSKYSRVNGHVLLCIAKWCPTFLRIRVQPQLFTHSCVCW